ncbi:HNH endonuclease signature motif containing protein [Arthrobacter sp. OY3WO11]|uniref:HNH endonuclease signature motif containing protein n=1 Tax=Arthrobacter sp. OY3WO11 TaxID=1835723 RepID=UPI0007D03012|nr:HNH endonuclease signature motif containing protein [Arthrobacter sp. OY3WO11]OAE00738.1 endonuclease [Arthrobacter sp. OY3WO11]
MERNPVVEAEAAVDASVAAFTAVLAGGCTAASGTAVSGSPYFGVAGGADDDPLQRVADGALDVLAGLARAEAKLAALKAQAVEVFAAATSLLNGPPSSPHEATAQDRSLVAEVGCALVIGDRAAGALLAESHAMTTSLPRTLAALQGGSISWAHARGMADEAATLDPAGAAALEAHFLDPDKPRPATAATIGEMPPHRFKAKARTWRERHHPESIEKRHAKGLADRRVEYRPDQDGMAWLSAYLPADQAMAGWNRLNALARAAQGPHEPRTLTQIRADHFAQAILTSGTSRGNGDSSSLRGGGSAGNGDSDWVGNGYGVGAGNRDGAGAGTAAGPSSSIRAQVLVTVPVFALMGLTDEPAMLDGYGPIPPSMARDLVASGADSFHRVLVDPRDGAPLEIGRTSYRVTKAMRNWLRMRDGTCPFPGCSNSSLDNEADHLLAWQHGGTTGISNLGQPCPRHHKLRHTTGWTPTQATHNEPPGWTSPSGRHYKSEHQDWEPPHWPQSVMSALPAGLRIPDDLSEAWPPPDELLQQRHFPDDLSSLRLSADDVAFENLFPHDEFPEDTFADWFLPGYRQPKDPLSEEAWWVVAGEGTAATP